MARPEADRASVAELHAFLGAHPGVTHVDAVVVDLCGIVRGKRCPRDELEKVYQAGLQLPSSVFVLDVTGANSDACGRGFSDGDPDGTCFPVPGTLAPAPWAGDAVAQVLLSMVEADGTPAAVEPRNIARAALARFAETGLRPVVAFELEFCLLDATREAGGVPRPPLSPLTGARDDTTQVYGIEELDGFSALFDDVTRAARAQGVPVSVATAEYGPGQYEINLRHESSPIAAADHCALLRHVVKSVARRHGVRATFMSKPFLDRTGNGMHVHMSLLDEDGRNVFDDGTEAGSERLRHAIGGMQATMADAMAVFAPNVNGFRRFQPRVYVPVTKSWGYNNRSVAFRVPAGLGEARRIEHRVAGADANPYLVLATLLAGVHHGLRERLDPGPPARGSACDEIDPDLPRSLEAALERLRGSPVIGGFLGADYLELYCETKRAELESFHDHISVREYDWYL